MTDERDIIFYGLFNKNGKAIDIIDFLSSLGLSFFGGGELCHIVPGKIAGQVNLVELSSRNEKEIAAKFLQDKSFIGLNALHGNVEITVDYKKDASNVDGLVARNEIMIRIRGSVAINIMAQAWFIAKEVASFFECDFLLVTLNGRFDIRYSYYGLDAGIRDVYWIMAFGPSLIQRAGIEQFSNLSVYKSEKIGPIIQVMASASPMPKDDPGWVMIDNYLRSRICKIMANDIGLNGIARQPIKIGCIAILWMLFSGRK